MDRVGFSGPDERMLREARMGLMVVAALFVSLIYFGFQYFRNQVNQIPDHVWAAPLAREIDPDQVLEMAKRRRSGLVNPEAVVQSPDITSQRFADQRTEFQPTQPLPRNMDQPAAAIQSSAPQQFISKSTQSTENPELSPAESSNYAAAQTERPKPRPLNPPTTIKPAESGAFQPTWNSSPIATPIATPDSPSVVAAPNIQAPERKDNDAAEQPQNTYRSAEKPIGLTALPGTASSRPSTPPAETSRADNPPPINPVAEISKPRLPSAREFQPLWPKTHVLQPHESLWDAAHKVYGDGQWFRALYQHNLDRLEAETDRRQTVSLDCPAPLDLAQKFPELVPAEIAEKDTTRADDKTRYVTIAGDCLFDIARQQLGQASRYLELLELNRDRLPPAVSHLTRLPVGLELKLPE